MLDSLTEYDGNALAITDKMVASDWRLGLLRGVARYVAFVATPEDSTDRWGTTTPGSDREHIEGSLDKRTNSRSAGCSLVEISNISQTEDTEYVDALYKEGSYRTVLKLSAIATCSCGRITDTEVSLQVPPDEFLDQMLWTNNPTHQ